MGTCGASWGGLKRRSIGGGASEEGMGVWPQWASKEGGRRCHQRHRAGVRVPEADLIVSPAQSLHAAPLAPRLVHCVADSPRLPAASSDPPPFVVDLGCGERRPQHMRAHARQCRGPTSSAPGRREGHAAEAAVRAVPLQDHDDVEEHPEQVHAERAARGDRGHGARLGSHRGVLREEVDREMAEERPAAQIERAVRAEKARSWRKSSGVSGAAVSAARWYPPLPRRVPASWWLLRGRRGNHAPRSPQSAA